MRSDCRHTLAALLLAVAACAAGGCGLPNLLVYPFAEREATRQVAHEYHLTAERLLILPFAGHDVLFEYPGAPLDISYQVIGQIQRYGDVRVRRVINPQQVALYQQSNLDWPNKLVAQIGREFQADKVLYIELNRYTMMEEGSANLYRGRISAHLQVVDPKAEGRLPLYETDVSVTVPEDQPAGVMDVSEDKLRQAAMFRFAEALVWKFVDHEEKVVKGK